MSDKDYDEDACWAENLNATRSDDQLVDPKVRCDECTACCCRKEVWLLGDTRVPGHLVVNDAWGGEVLERLDDGWCAALDRQTLRCSIYAYRPQVCRDVLMGGYECIEARSRPLDD